MRITTNNTNDHLRTKVIQAEITETRTRYVTVEVPLDASNSDDALLYELSEIWTDDLGEQEDVHVNISETDHSPEFRLDMQNGRWHVTQLGYDTLERRNLAHAHARIVRSQEGSGDLYFNRVTVEFPNERLALGCLYYRMGYAVVVVGTEDGCRIGLLRGFDRCYPAFADAGPIPWDIVDELEELDESCGCGPLGTVVPFERAAERMSELEPEKRAERPFMVPGLTIVQPKPRRAVDPGELYRRFQRSSYKADVTA